MSAYELTPSFPSDAVPLYARELGHRQIGALIGFQTGAAVYVGTLWGLSIFEEHIFITVKRDGAEGKAQVKPDQLVYIALATREAKQ